MKLKVCGMREIENISALAELQPEYMGFIFWAPSSRCIEQLTPPLPSSIKKTGVFVDDVSVLSGEPRLTKSTPFIDNFFTKILNLNIS